MSSYMKDKQGLRGGIRKPGSVPAWQESELDLYSNSPLFWIAQEAIGILGSVLVTATQASWGPGQSAFTYAGDRMMASILFWTNVPGSASFLDEVRKRSWARTQGRLECTCRCSVLAPPGSSLHQSLPGQSSKVIFVCWLCFCFSFVLFVTFQLTPPIWSGNFC